MEERRRFDPRIHAIEQKLDQILGLLQGKNGEPGLIVRLDRIEQW